MRKVLLCLLGGGRLRRVFAKGRFGPCKVNPSRMELGVRKGMCRRERKIGQSHRPKSRTRLWHKYKHCRRQLRQRAHWTTVTTIHFASLDEDTKLQAGRLGGLL